MPTLGAVIYLIAKPDLRFRIVFFMSHHGLFPYLKKYQWFRWQIAPDSVEMFFIMSSVDLILPFQNVKNLFFGWGCRHVRSITQWPGFIKLWNCYRQILFLSFLAQFLLNLSLYWFLFAQKKKDCSDCRLLGKLSAFFFRIHIDWTLSVVPRSG